MPTKNALLYADWVPPNTPVYAPFREVDNSFESLGTFGILTTVADPMLMLGYLGMIGSVT